VIEQPKLHLRIDGWQRSASIRRDWCSKIWASTFCCALSLFGSDAAATDRPSIEPRATTSPSNSAATSAVPPKTKALQECLAEGGGFLRARLTGSIKSELNWNNKDTECSGATRPNGGVRMRFSHDFGKDGQRLVLVFGIPGLREGIDARELRVNVTLIREGAGAFYGTQGDDKCTIDRLHQEALAGIPLRNRLYRVTASGFCTQPARAIANEGSVLITRFDFAGRIDYSEADAVADEQVVAH
jgi:hypothetical protein